MAIPKLPKLMPWVRFPSPAPNSFESDLFIPSSSYFVYSSQPDLIGQLFASVHHPLTSENQWSGYAIIAGQPAQIG